MRKFIKLLALIMVLSLAFSAFGCGGDGSTETPPAETPPTEQTPLGDATYLDKNAKETYEDILAYVSSLTNFTLSEDSVMDMTYISNSASNTYNGVKALCDSLYAENGYKLHCKTIGYANIFGMESNDTITMVDGKIYMLSSMLKVWDYGTMDDLSNLAGVSIDVRESPLYVPSEQSLAAGYFNVSEDGAILTVVISGQEAEDYFNEYVYAQNGGISYEVSDITYKIHLDTEGNLVKIQVCLDYDCNYGNGDKVVVKNFVNTVVIEDVGSTVVAAPADANTYNYLDFITGNPV